MVVSHLTEFESSPLALTNAENPVPINGAGLEKRHRGCVRNVRVRIGTSRGRRLVKLSLYRCHDYVHDGAGVMPSRNLGRERLASH